MKNLSFLLLLAMISCGPPRSDESQIMVRTLGQSEQEIHDYFLEIEHQLKIEAGIDSTELMNAMQDLINNQEIKKPEIFVETDSGTTALFVTYEEYKFHRTIHPIDTGRVWTVEYERNPGTEAEVLNETIVRQYTTSEEHAE